MASNIQYTGDFMNDISNTKKALLLVLMEEDRPYGVGFTTCAEANDFVLKEFGSWRGFNLIPVEVEYEKCPVCGRGVGQTSGGDYRGSTIAPGCGCARCNPAPQASSY